MDQFTKTEFIERVMLIQKSINHLSTRIQSHNTPKDEYPYTLELQDTLQALESSIYDLDGARFSLERIETE